MLSLPLALLSLLPLIKAQSTVSLLMPQAGPSQSLVASIVNADATATTYFINCANATTSSSSPLSASASSLGNFPSSSSSAECGFAPSGVTHIQGPSTAVYTYSSDTSTAAVSCQLTGTTRAVCTASSNFASDTRTDMPAMASGTDMLSAYAPESASASAPAMTSGPSFSTLSDGRQVVTLVASDLSGVFLPVVVTAGQQKAMGASGSGSGSGMGSTSTATGSAGTKTTATGGSATGSTATGGTATGSAAAQKATGAAGRVSVEGVVGGMGALAVGVVAAML